MDLGQRTNDKGAGTAGRILECARRAFNERGVAAVGVREIARDLGLSPGNVSYHFSTKEALVVALILKVHDENNASVAAADSAFDFTKLGSILRGIMRRDLENQWFSRDAAGLLTALPALRPIQKRMQRARDARVDSIVERLIAADLLDRKRTEEGLAYLRQQILTQVFFWLPAAIISEPDRDPAQCLDLHADATLALFLPYCTPKGRRQLEPLLARASPWRGGAAGSPAPAPSPRKPQRRGRSGSSS